MRTRKRELGDYVTVVKDCQNEQAVGVTQIDLVNPSKGREWVKLTQQIDDQCVPWMREKEAED